MAVSIVQSAPVAASGTAGSKSETVTLATAPTVGNVLWGTFLVHGGTSETIGIPTGWTQQARVDSGTTESVVIAYRVVQAGDGTAYTFTTTTTTLMCATITEITGQAASSWLNMGVAKANANATSQTTATITPTVDNCMILADIGSVLSVGTWTPTTGWTTTQSYTTAGTTTSGEAILEEYILQTTAAAISATVTEGTSHITDTYIAAFAPGVTNVDPFPLVYDVKLQHTQNAIYRM